MRLRKYLFIAFTAIVLMTTGKAPGAVNLKVPERPCLMKADSGVDGRARS